ncbi:MAG TPA: 30S ribosomal protein S9 [bacterium]|nr:30S ribosomal protein S9 [bacterium]
MATPTPIQQFHGLGRRKTSTVRIFLRPGGTGKITVNGRDVQDYFNRARHFEAIHRPLEVTGRLRDHDVVITAEGGGMTGQADAIKLGIARALEKEDPSLRHVLKDSGCLTRDPREKERKKYGQKRARKQFQFSKR